MHAVCIRRRDACRTCNPASECCAFVFVCVLSEWAIGAHINTNEKQPDDVHVPLSNAPAPRLVHLSHTKPPRMRQRKRDTRWFAFVLLLLLLARFMLMKISVRCVCVCVFATENTVSSTRTNQLALYIPSAHISLAHTTRHDTPCAHNWERTKKVCKRCCASTERNTCASCLLVVCSSI